MVRQKGRDRERETGELGSVDAKRGGTGSFQEAQLFFVLAQYGKVECRVDA